MRKVGDILYITWNNQYYGQKCKITKVSKLKNTTTFDIELLEKQDGWLKNEGLVTLTFSNVNYEHLKEVI